MGWRWAKTKGLGAAVIIAYGFVRWLRFQQPPAWGGIDSIAYLGVAKRGWLDPALWAGAKPPMVPVFYKLLHTRETWIQNGQFAVATVAWLFLAAQVAKLLPNAGLRACAFGLVLWFSLARSIVVFDSGLLSESLAVSLGVALCGGVAWFTRAASRGALASVLLTALLWGLTRDSNALLLLAAVPMLAVSAFVRFSWRGEGLKGPVVAPTLRLRWRRDSLALCLGLVGVCGLSTLSLEKSPTRGEWEWFPYPVEGGMTKRWVFSFGNVMGQRILPVPEYASWFAKRGMPLDAAVLQLSGGWASTNDCALYREPSLHEFRTWLTSRGKRTYLAFLASHPNRALGDSVRAWGDLVGGPPEIPMVKGGYPILNALGDALYPQRIPFPVLAGSAIMAFWRGIILRDRRWALVLGLSVLEFVHVAVVWHGDAMEVPRHALQANLQARMILLFSAALLLELVAAQWRLHRHPQHLA